MEQQQQQDGDDGGKEELVEGNDSSSIHITFFRELKRKINFLFLFFSNFFV